MSDKTVEITINGLAELQQQLEELPRMIAQKILKTTLQELGDELAIKLFQEAPVSDEVRSSPGWLAGHMGTSFHTHEDDIAASIMVGGKFVDYPRRGTKIRHHKHSDDFYGSTIDVPDIVYWLEKGTKGNLKQNEFMTRAWDGFKDYALERMILDISDAIDTAVK